ncbi:hypothetical protein EUX98_g5699 [Antrodiella citrinella]|uniref:DUF6534 domain-containing protein n=1 Tax=Antrodiella citrinella TaxID=2447956 RepID=A0A4S4MTI9_9APHY|nr:hypothetical protein EUX98_g5699 [Antrodiella citrinella]
MTAAPTIQDLLGGYVIEAFVALVLYGIFIAQTYVYAMNCSKDALYMKLCVMCIAVLETLHSAFMSHMIYWYAIDSFGNIAGVGRIIWSGGATVICEMLIVAFVQSLYLRRVYILSEGNRVLTSIISLTLLARLAVGLATAALLLTLRSWADFRTSKAFYTVVVGLALSSLVDLMIALTLIYYLWKNKTGFTSTDNIMHVLMAYCVNSGMLTMMCSTATIFTFSTMKTSLLFAGFYQISSKLYANSLMGTLNARDFLRQMSTSGRSRFNETSDLGVHFESQDAAPRHIEIFQEASKVVRSDVDLELELEVPDGSVASDTVRGINGLGSYKEMTKGYPLF